MGKPQVSGANQDFLSWLVLSRLRITRTAGAGVFCPLLFFLFFLPITPRTPPLTTRERPGRDRRLGASQGWNSSVGYEPVMKELAKNVVQNLTTVSDSIWQLIFPYIFCFHSPLPWRVPSSFEENMFRRKCFSIRTQLGCSCLAILHQIMPKLM